MKSTPLFFTICLAAIVTWTNPSSAQTAPLPKTAEAAATAYFDAIKSGNLDNVTAIMDADDMKRFKESMAPGMLKAMETPRGKSSLSLMMDVNGPEDIKSMAPDVFFKKFFSSMLASTPGFQEAMARSKITVVGTVNEGTKVHVLARSTMTLNEVEITKLDIVSVTKDGAGYRVLVSGEMQNMARLMKRKVAQDS